MGPLQFQVVGTSTYDFTDDNGRHVSGTKFHVIRSHQVKTALGHEACSFTVPEGVLLAYGQPQIGAVYDASYSPKGRLLAYTPAKAEQAPSNRPPRQ